MHPRSKNKPEFPTHEKPSRISTNKVLQWWLINTVHYLLVKNNEGGGEGGLREKGRGLLTFFLWKEGAY